MIIDFDKYKSTINSAHITKDTGRVTEVIGLMIKGYLPGAQMGALVEILPRGGEKPFLAEVVAFKDEQVLLMSLSHFFGVGNGAELKLKDNETRIRVTEQMLGRVLDPIGNPIDELPALQGYIDWPLYQEVRNPLKRSPIREPLDLGIRALNGLNTVGKGQRVAIMAGSGVGKSMLLGQMARSSQADVNVVALIGERGREVREFIENDLGPEGLKKTVIIVATSDQSPLLRMRGAFFATAIAEYFASLGKNVLFMMDSVTRFAMAQREIGLSAGEPPASKGYTPSVFSTLPKLLERAGQFEGEGSITGLYTVLVEGDDMNDPIGDAVRSIVDGHIVLSRKLSHKGHFPAIDILQSSSRVMKNVTSKEHQKWSQNLKQALAIYTEYEDLIQIGAYQKGINPKLDRAYQEIEAIRMFLTQHFEEGSNMTQTLRNLQELSTRL